MEAQQQRVVQVVPFKQREGKRKRKETATVTVIKHLLQKLVSVCPSDKSLRIDSVGERAHVCELSGDTDRCDHCNAPSLHLPSSSPQMMTRIPSSSSSSSSPSPIFFLVRK